jgi:hypothetical protein
LPQTIWACFQSRDCGRCSEVIHYRSSVCSVIHSSSAYWWPTNKVTVWTTVKFEWKTEFVYSNVMEERSLNRSVSYLSLFNSFDSTGPFTNPFWGGIVGRRKRMNTFGMLVLWWQGQHPDREQWDISSQLCCTLPRIRALNSSMNGDPIWFGVTKELLTLFKFHRLIKSHCM